MFHFFYVVSNLCVFVIIWSSFNAPSDYRFQKAWRFVKKYPALLRPRISLEISIRQEFPQNSQNIVYLDILRMLNRLKIDFNAPILPVNEEPFLDLARHKRPLVIVGLHSDISTSFNPLAERLGVEWAVITSLPEAPERSKWFGLKGMLATIPDSDACFLIARQEMRHGKAIFCCPDFFGERHPSRPREYFISSGIFEFARRTDATLIYVMPVLTESGSILYHFSDPRTAKDFVSVQAIIAEFIEYMKSFPEVHKEWKIAKPSEVAVQA